MPGRTENTEQAGVGVSARVGEGWIGLTTLRDASNERLRIGHSSRAGGRALFAFVGDFLTARFNGHEAMLLN